MKNIIIALILITTPRIYSQIDLSAGMGLSFFTAPDFENYANSFSQLDVVNSFNTSADFFMEIGYNVNSKYQIALEYNFNIYSVNSQIINIELFHHKPSIIGYYTLSGKGYKLKLGGGVGLRISQSEERIFSYGSTENYSATGFGFLLKAQGDTKLSGNLYALIAGEIRYDLPGEISTFNGISETIYSLNSFSIGLKLGSVYYF